MTGLSSRLDSAETAAEGAHVIERSVVEKVEERVANIRENMTQMQEKINKVNRSH